MTTRNQILFSIGLVAVAAAFVFVRTGRQAVAETPAQGHDHAAMAAASSEPSPVHLDPESARRIGVTYAVVTNKPFRRSVNTVGAVTWDETRLASVNPRIEGWVEKLFVDFTGASVRAGEPLLAIYSPMLVSAQEELIMARRLYDNAVKAGADRTAGNATELLDAARRRLRYWDIPEDEIARIEEAGTPQRTLTLRSPASGIIVEKNVVEGARIMPGMEIYRIADLSRVWIEGEVFEKDLSLVHLGQVAAVTFDAYPGKVFGGRVTWVYPTVSTESRTGRVRVELANPGQRLKPGMYAKLELSADADRMTLLVPRDAVHFTGERAIVFVRESDGMLTPRVVTPGLAAGNEVEILGGLVEGDVVVASANFLIDAESNMGATMGSMPGMDMGPPATPPAKRDTMTMAPGSTMDHSGH
jgi:membrane fusion protein, copper/silver efflux system